MLVPHGGEAVSKLSDLLTAAEEMVTVIHAERDLPGAKPYILRTYKLDPALERFEAAIAAAKRQDPPTHRATWRCPSHDFSVSITGSEAAMRGDAYLPDVILGFAQHIDATLDSHVFQKAAGVVSRIEREIEVLA